jgi:hypothetical protein
LAQTAVAEKDGPQRKAGGKKKVKKRYSPPQIFSEV